MKLYEVVFKNSKDPEDAAVKELAATSIKFAMLSEVFTPYYEQANKEFLSVYSKLSRLYECDVTSPEQQVKMCMAVNTLRMKIKGLYARMQDLANDRPTVH